MLASIQLHDCFLQAIEEDHSDQHPAEMLSTQATINASPGACAKVFIA